MNDLNGYAVFFFPQALEALGDAIKPYLQEGKAGPHLLCREIDTGGALVEMTLDGRTPQGQQVDLELMVPTSMVRMIVSARGEEAFGFGPRTAAVAPVVEEANAKAGQVATDDAASPADAASTAAGVAAGARPAKVPAAGSPESPGIASKDAGDQKADVIARVVEGVRQLTAHAGPAGVTVIIESHGDFTSSVDLESIITDVGSDAFALLWDAHHTFVSGKEQPADTYERLGKWVRHTHLKDSKPGGKDRQYVLVGDGEVPVETQVQVLAANGYKGYYGFEWEKRWHPEIAEPEMAFPHYAKTVGAYLAAAGISPS